MAKNYKNNNKRNNNHYRNGRAPKKDVEVQADKGPVIKDEYFKTDRCHSNDPAWWNKAASVFRDAVKVPFNRLSGYVNRVNLGILKNDGSFENGNTLPNPSIMVIDYVPGIGAASTHTDAPNRAFQQVFSKIYSMTSGAIQVTQADVSMFCVAMQSIAQNIALAKRALLTAKIYNAVNGAFPRPAISAMGMDADDIIANQANYRLALNNVILDFNSLPVINNFPIYTRQYMLANSVFQDNIGAKSQIYIFRPSVYYMYSDLGLYDEANDKYEGAARCIAQTYPWVNGGPRMTFEGLIEVIQQQIRMVRTSSNFVLLSGLIMKAFPDSNFLRIAYVNETDVQEFTADDPFVSYQIHNLTYAGELADFDVVHEQPNFGTLREYNFQPRYDIACDPVNDLLVYKPILQNREPELVPIPYVQGAERVLNSFENQVDDNWIMESTRLMVSVDLPNTAYTNYVEVVSASTEIVTGLAIVTVSGTTSNPVWYTTQLSPVMTALYDGDDAVIQLERFHKAPRIIVAKDGEPWNDCRLTGDVHNWTTVSDQALKGLNDAALLSIFGIEE